MGTRELTPAHFDERQWWEQPASRQRAVEFFEGQLAHVLNLRAIDRAQKKPIAEFDITIRLPISIAQLVLESARDGQHLGRKARPLQSRGDERALRNVAAWARERETKLKVEGKSADESEQQALEEARVNTPPPKRRWLRVTA
jgi:hypothetical protein